MFRAIARAPGLSETSHYDKTWKLRLSKACTPRQDNAKAALETLQKAFAEAVVSAPYEAGTSSALQPRNRLDISASPAVPTSNSGPGAFRFGKRLCFYL